MRILCKILEVDLCGILEVDLLSQIKWSGGLLTDYHPSMIRRPQNRSYALGGRVMNYLIRNHYLSKK